MRMADGAGRRKKQKTALIPKGTKAVALLRGTTQIAKDKYFVPCRFRRVNAALRPTSLAGSSGAA